MAVTVKLPTQLRDAAGGAAEAQAPGGTVGEVLEALYACLLYTSPSPRDRS